MYTDNTPIKRLAIYRECGEVIRIDGGWTIEELSLEYPICSSTGIDSLLYFVPEEERDTVTIEFYDGSNRVIPDDPRVHIEYLD